MNVGTHLLAKPGAGRIMQTQLRAGSFVLGGLFIGLWLYALIFGVPEWRTFEVSYWALWGVVGLVITGGVFGGRVANDHARIAIWTATGIAVGLLAGAAIFQRIAEAFAALLTFLGGALVISAIPMGDQNWQPVEDVEPEA